MNKQTKMYLGLALVGIAGYMLYKQSKKPAAASFTGRNISSVGDRSKFNNFATASTVIDGRMSVPSHQKHTVSQF